MRQAVKAQTSNIYLNGMKEIRKREAGDLINSQFM